MLDWRTGDDAWSDDGEQRHHDEPRPPIRWQVPQWLLFVCGVLVVAVAATGVVLRWKSRQQMARLRADIQATVDTETWARETHNLKLYRSLLDPSAHSGWLRHQAQAFRNNDQREPARMTVTDVMMFGSGLAVAELEVRPAKAPSYLATRAYRRSGGMWLETSIPDGQVWLDQVTRETENLRFVFHRRDVEDMVVIMPAIQQFYTQLLKDLRLSPPQGKRTLYVIHSVRPIKSELPDDPTYYDISDLGSDVGTEAIKRRIGALLLDQVMALFRTEQGDLSFLLRAVQEWEYADWLDVPLPSSRTASAQELLVSLPFLSLTDEAWKSLQHPAAQAAVGQALVDYVVTAYGRDRLADVVRTVQRYDNWYPFVTQALHATQVLEAPFVEFDAGWRNHALDTFTEREGTRLGTLAPERAFFLKLLSTEQRAVTHNEFDDYTGLLSEEGVAATAFRFGDGQTSDQPIGWWDSHRLLFNTYQKFRQRTNAPFRIDLLDVIVDEDDALVRVRVYFPDPGAAPYEEVRTYRRSGGVWKWNGVRASFLGNSFVEVTPRLRVTFKRQDAQVVRQEMAATESFLQRISHDLDLAVRTDEWLLPQIAIDVVPSYRVLDWRGDDEGVRILSPSLGAIATSMSPADFYRVSAGMALSRKLIAAQAGEPQTPFAEALFEAVARWETEQWAPEVPWEWPRRRAIVETLRGEGFPSLSEQPTWTELRVDPAVGYLYDSVVAYIVETHGRTTLGSVIQRAPQHQSWSTLISNVLDVEIEAFEAGWTDYVRLQVGRSEG